MDKRLAEETSALMLDVTARLDAQLFKIKEQCSEAEFLRFRRGFGYVLGCILTETMIPIYGEHPDLRPPHLESN